MPTRRCPKFKLCSTISSVSRNSKTSGSGSPPSARAASSTRSSIPSLSPDIAAGPVVCLHGKGVARGYAIGRAVVMGAAALEVAHYRIAPEDAAAESQRLTEALAKAQADLLQMADTLPRTRRASWAPCSMCTGCCWAILCWPSRPWR